MPIFRPQYTDPGVLAALQAAVRNAQYEQARKDSQQDQEQQSMRGFAKNVQQQEQQGIENQQWDQTHDLRQQLADLEGSKVQNQQAGMRALMDAYRARYGGGGGPPQSAGAAPSGGIAGATGPGTLAAPPPPQGAAKAFGEMGEWFGLGGGGGGGGGPQMGGNAPAAAMTQSIGRGPGGVQNLASHYMNPGGAVNPPPAPARQAPGSSGGDSSGYDTKLTPEEETLFQQWKAKYAPHDSGQDYDLRGAFKAGLTPDATGHWHDKFKKPNHPTLSDESKYAGPNAPRWQDGKLVPKGPGELPFPSGQLTLPQLKLWLLSKGAETERGDEAAELERELANYLEVGKARADMYPQQSDRFLGLNVPGGSIEGLTRRYQALGAKGGEDVLEDAATRDAKDGEKALEIAINEAFQKEFASGGEVKAPKHLRDHFTRQHIDAINDEKVRRKKEAAAKKKLEGEQAARLAYEEALRTGGKLAPEHVPHTTKGELRSLSYAQARRKDADTRAELLKKQLVRVNEQIAALRKKAGENPMVQELIDLAAAKARTAYRTKASMIESSANPKLFTTPAQTAAANAEVEALVSAADMEIERLTRTIGAKGKNLTPDEALGTEGGRKYDPTTGEPLRMKGESDDDWIRARIDHKTRGKK